MAEEFHSGGGVCGGNWWNPPRTRSAVSFSGGSAPCSTASHIDINGSFGWPTEMGDVRQGSSDESASVSDSSNITVFPAADIHKPQLPADSSTGNDTVLTDSTLQIMTGFNLPSPAPSSDWNPALLHGVGRAGNNYQSMLRQDLGPVPRLNYNQQEDATMAAAMDISPQNIQKDWITTTNLATPSTATATATSGSGSNQEITIIHHPFNKPILNLNQGFPSLDQLSNNSGASSGDCIVTFPMASPSYPYPSPTTLLQSETDNLSYYANPSTSTGHQFVPSAWPNNNNNFSTPTPTATTGFLKPSLFPKVLQQPSTDQLHLSNKNNATFWNYNASAAAGFPAFCPDQSLTQFFTPVFEEKPSIPNLPPKNYRTEDERESVSAAAAAVKRSSTSSSSSGGALIKRPRIETPSPLPAFKVRKEKLGDRVTALQQLVSPFGKTDTASVLHEAIEYIKFLHEKVGVLSSPYLKNGPHFQHQQACEKLKEADGPKQDLRSRGLCVVPIPNTFPVADEATADFWTPTYGGPYR